MEKETNIILVETKVEAVRVNVFVKQIKILFSKELILFRSLCDKSQTAKTGSVIVSELECCEDVEHLFETTKTEIPKDATMVNSKWLSDCIRAKKLEPPTKQHLLQCKTPKISQAPVQAPQESPQVEFLCQMKCPLKHHNSIFTDALSILGRSAEHNYGITKDAQYYAKALAFDRAAGYLKSLDHRVASTAELANCRYLGSHALRVIGELVDFGASAEVDAVLSTDVYQSMVKLTSVYGVGQSLAYKWYQRGVKDPACAAQRMLQWEREGKRDPDFVGADYRRLQAGLAFHADLCDRPFTRPEADRWRSHVADLLARLRGPGYRVALVGGFARGKPTGHDCDLLITHAVEGREVGAVADVADALADAGRVIHGAYEANSFHGGVLSRDFRVKELRSTLDHFEKWLGVVRLPCDDCGDAADSPSSPPPAKKTKKSTASSAASSYCAFGSLAEAMSMAETEAAGRRRWLARRVDLIGVPQSQYHYALLGWTGNRMFNRDLRLFAQRQRRMKLTSHGLFDLQRETSLPAGSEEEIFGHLGLEYISPELRNC